MRLELRAIAGPMSNSPPKWFFERGRRTLGRSPDCDWQVPEDQRSVSKLHCTIERDAKGFVLRDQSANGSRVDGTIVHEGETAKLSDRCRIEVGNLTFSVHISGEAQDDIEEPDTSFAASDEPLTISAILADIAPGGRTATGILGNRASDDWLEPLARKDRPSPSRNIDIGWNGPPEIRPTGNILPDDWNLDDGKTGHSDYGSHLEHGSATHVAVPVSRARSSVPLRAEDDDAVPPEAETEHLPSPAQSGSRPGDLVAKLDPLLRRLEDALEATYAVFGLDMPPTETGLDFFSQGRDDALLARVQHLLSRQVRLQTDLDNLVHHAGHAFEPRVIEARIDANAGPFRFLRGRNYWHAYKTQFERNGRTLSVQDIFRDAMMRTETRQPSPVLPAEEKEDRTDEE